MFHCDCVRTHEAWHPKEDRILLLGLGVLEEVVVHQPHRHSYKGTLLEVLCPKEKLYRLQVCRVLWCSCTSASSTSTVSSEFWITQLEYWWKGERRRMSQSSEVSSTLASINIWYQAYQDAQQLETSFFGSCSMTVIRCSNSNSQKAWCWWSMGLWLLCLGIQFLLKMPWSIWKFWLS